MYIYITKSEIVKYKKKNNEEAVMESFDQIISCFGRKKYKTKK